MLRARWSRIVAAGVALALAGITAACGDDDGPPEAAEDAVVYVALGDSFSSGEGAPPYDDQSQCRQAELAWPRRLYADGDGFVSIEHRACAGARTEHLAGGWADRNLPAQIATEPDPDVTLVTVTIGGNDLGFGDIVGACVLSRCPEPDDPDFVERLTTLTDTLRRSVHPALAAAYPEARIAHVGYPRLTPAPGEDVEGCGWLDDEDQSRAAAILAALDDAIRSAADTSEGAVEYVDVSDAFAGHELCTSESWLNPVGVGAGYAHPNAAGQQALEEAVAAALGITF